MKPRNWNKRNGHDPNQIEFGIIWQLPEYPFRLRAGDVLRFNDGKLGRVLRVNECSAVIIMNQPVRNFRTRFDKPVRFQPPPKTFRISPNAEVEIIKARRR